MTSGPPIHDRIVDSRGYVTLPWTAFFRSPVPSPTIIGSHLERVNSYPAQSQKLGTMFAEYDRYTVYLLSDMASPIATAVDQDSTTGTPTLYVSATQGFRVGQLIYVGQGTAREEIRVVLGITNGVSLTVANLTYTHTTAQSDRVTCSPHTSVDFLSPAGGATLRVASTLGFYEGQTILIAPNTAAQEYKVIAAVTAGVSFTLETNLAFDHTAAQAHRVGVGPEWVYLHGMHEGTLAQIPADLTRLDGGFLFRATDYDRIWRWTGTVWERAPGELPTLFVGLFCAAPGTGWKVLDGAGNPFTYTLANATTATVTVQDARAHYPKMAAAFTGLQVAAVAPALTGAPGGGTTTGLTVNSGAAVIGGPNATQGVQSGGGVTVAAYNHAHTDSGHAHAVTDPGHDHGAGTLAVDATGEPAHMEFLPFVKL